MIQILTIHYIQKLQLVKWMWYGNSVKPKNLKLSRLGCTAPTYTLKIKHLHLKPLVTASKQISLNSRFVLYRLIIALISWLSWRRWIGKRMCIYYNFDMRASTQIQTELPERYEDIIIKKVMISFCNNLCNYKLLFCI